MKTTRFPLIAFSIALLFRLAAPAALQSPLCIGTPSTPNRMTWTAFDACRAAGKSETKISGRQPRRPFVRQILRRIQKHQLRQAKGHPPVLHAVFDHAEHVTFCITARITFHLNENAGQQLGFLGSYNPALGADVMWHVNKATPSTSYLLCCRAACKLLENVS